VKNEELFSVELPQPHHFYLFKQPVKQNWIEISMSSAYKIPLIIKLAQSRFSRFFNSQVQSVWKVTKTQNLGIEYLYNKISGFFSSSGLI